MITYLKKIIPNKIKKRIIPIKKKLIDDPKKKILFKKMSRKHTQLIEKIRNKKKIKVLFPVIHKSVWKVDSVFRKMLEDPFFEPVILICPYTINSKEDLDEMYQCYDFFLQKEYPTILSLDKKNNTWITLNEINPDIVFFTNPHNITRKEYYSNAYKNYLSCYVPYAHNVSKYDSYNSQYNQNFHNSMWLIFTPHTEDLKIFRDHSARQEHNIITTGYPACENLLGTIKKETWKPQEKTKIKLIWAPHHTIENVNLPYSNFLNYSDLFIKLTKKHKNEIQFSFKPHPMLKEKLYAHPNWGKKRTEKYFQYWKITSNTQLDEGEYTDLFISSDAMIHDSGSFLAEYQYLNKPVMYICNNLTIEFLNPFGIKALESCYIAKNKADIEKFINKLLDESLKVDRSFFKEYIEPFFVHELPSDRIISKIKSYITSN